MAENEPPKTDAEAASVDLAKIPEEVRQVLFAQENRLVAVENLFLQFALDMNTVATVLNGVQSCVPGLKHVTIRRDLEEIHEKWLGLLKQAEAIGRIKFSRISPLIVPSRVK